MTGSTLLSTIAYIPTLPYNPLKKDVLWCSKVFPMRKNLLSRPEKVILKQSAIGCEGVGGAVGSEGWRWVEGRGSHFRVGAFGTLCKQKK